MMEYKKYNTRLKQPLGFGSVNLQPRVQVQSVKDKIDFIDPIESLIPLTQHNT